MVITYSQDRPVTVAVSDTFDGHHPCKLCKQIEKGKRAEKKSEFQLESSKIKFAHVLTPLVSATPPLLWEVAVADEQAALLTRAPAVPPPRQLPG